MAIRPSGLPSINQLSEKDCQTLTAHDHLHAHGHDDHDHLIINPIDDHKSVPTSPLMGSHSPPSDHEDDGFLSDIPSESEAELEILPSFPTTERQHHPAPPVSSDDVEFPVFLGRQADDTAIVIPSEEEDAVPARRNTGGRSAPTLAPTHQADSISGPMMPLWPSLIDATECDFPICLGRQSESPASKPTERTSSTLPSQPLNNNKTPATKYEEPVVNLSGPEMFWWPSAMDASGYESEALINTWWRTPTSVVGH